MKKIKKTIVLVAIVAAAVGGYQGYKAYNKPIEGSMFMQNVEALSQEEIQPLKCKRAIDAFCGFCYREIKITLSDGTTHTYPEVCGNYIDAVEEYEVYPGSPIICKHDEIHDCPPNTHR